MPEPLSAERPRARLRPAFLASLGLHLAVLAGLLISWRFAPPLATPVSVTPVTLVANAPDTNVRAAAQAPEHQTAAAPEPSPPTPEPPAAEETPTPEPKPAPPPPEPAPEPRPQPKPRPVPPKPQPAPKPAPAPKPIPKPEPKPQLDLDDLSKAKPQPKTRPLDLSALSKSKAKAQDLDLAALTSTPTRSRSHAASLDLSALSDTSGGHRASTRGPARAETDRTARQAAGAATGLDANALGALTAKVIRLWRPNCGVEGATGVVVKVRIRLDADHNLVGAPTVLSKGSASADPAVVDAAAQRARAAVAQGAPYTELPADAPRDIVLNFNARQACEG